MSHLKNLTACGVALGLLLATQPAFSATPVPVRLPSVVMELSAPPAAAFCKTGISYGTITGRFPMTQTRYGPVSWPSNVPVQVVYQFYDDSTPVAGRTMRKALLSAKPNIAADQAIPAQVSAQTSFAQSGYSGKLTLTLVSATVLWPSKPSEPLTVNGTATVSYSCPVPEATLAPGDVRQIAAKGTIVGPSHLEITRCPNDHLVSGTLTITNFPTGWPKEIPLTVHYQWIINGPNGRTLSDVITVQLSPLHPTTPVSIDVPLTHDPDFTQTGGGAALTVVGIGGSRVSLGGGSVSWRVHDCPAT